ncbi:MAG: membrane protein insertase YidC [Chlorobi bacterium]|nr:membrane protein insertase YidC [Chlorobiota bacterium]
MDKRTFSAFILIGLVFLVWSLLFSPRQEPPRQGEKVDTNRPVQTTPDSNTTPSPAPGDSIPQMTVVDTTDPYYTWKQGEQRFVTIETPLYTAVLTTRGGLLYRFSLKKYNSWYGSPVQLINDSAGYGGELDIALRTPDGGELHTRDFFFDIPEEGTITLDEGDSVVITARLHSPATREKGLDSTTDANPVSTLEKQFVFHGSKYDLDVNIKTPDNNGYTVNWHKGLMFQEWNSVDESSQAQAYVMINDELKDFNADVGEPNESESFSGPIDWVGTKTKYFAAALIPSTPLNSQATLSGQAIKLDTNNGMIEQYNFSLAVPAGNQTTDFTLFLGPLDFDIAKEHDLTGMVSYGFLEFIIRPISEYLLLPIFRFLHSFISNWGIVIIVFSLLLRAALWPLSIPQIKSSEKMRLVQPVIADAREKFKDDPQKMQMETMKVYREYGVNPIGGCFPLLLQLPILYALWTTLANAIDLRQAGFALWIQDLSVPDTLLSLPDLPLLGNQLSGLALIMGATLFIQQKLMITDPKQKALVYIMPIFLTIIFNNFPSGLNLYYFIYNLLSIAQHYYMRSMADKSGLTLDDLKKQTKNKKKGWLATKMEQAQKMAEMQGRVPPGSKKR